MTLLLQAKWQISTFNAQIVNSIIKTYFVVSELDPYPTQEQNPCQKIQLQEGEILP